MLTRRILLAGLALSTGLFAAVQAAPFATFDQSAFDAALAAKKPVIVSIHADWCPTCKAQKPVLDGLLTDKFKTMQAFTVNFDTEKDVVRAFGAQMQSTLIVFKDGKEAGRSVGDTDPASIEALLASAN